MADVFMILKKNVKLRKSRSDHCDFTIFLLIFQKKCQKIFMKTITASCGARVCGSVFKIKFKALAEEFESIETFPGFVHLLGEN